MERNMKEIGKIIKKKEEVFIISLMEASIQEIGKMIKKKVKEFFIIKMEIDMRGNIKMIKDMERELFIMIMGTEKWVIFQMGNKLENMLNYYIIKKSWQIIIG